MHAAFFRPREVMVKLAGTDFENTPWVPKGKLESVLQPGDIIFTSPLKPETPLNPVVKVFADLYNKGSGGLQGKFTHAAIYTGGGTMVESRINEGVRKKDLREGIKNVDIVVVRPNLEKEERADAARFAETQVGKGYDSLSTVMLAAGLVLPEAVTEAISKGLMKPPEDAKAWSCSNLVAAAYKGADLTDVGVALAAPVDLLHTDRGTAIARSRFMNGAYRAPTAGRLSRG